MKEGMRRLASGVSVISCENDVGQKFAMTASSVTSLSDSPPSLLVCVNKSARICAELTVGTQFAVNVLGQAHQDVSVQCSSIKKADQRFNVGNWQTDAGTPILADAESNFVCVVDGLMAYGSHHVVVGKILQVSVAETPVDPLVYLNGGYRKLLE